MILTCVFSLFREKLHQSAAYGYKVKEEDTKFDWPTLKAKRDKYIERLNGIYEKSEPQISVASSKQH